MSGASVTVVIRVSHPKWCGPWRACCHARLLEIALRSARGRLPSSAHVAPVARRVHACRRSRCATQGDGEPIAVVHSVRGSRLRTQDPNGRNLAPAGLLRRTGTVRLEWDDRRVAEGVPARSGGSGRRRTKCRGSFRPVSADEPAASGHSFRKIGRPTVGCLPNSFVAALGDDELPEHALVVVGSEETDLPDAVRQRPAWQLSRRLAPVPDAGAPNADAEYNFTLLVTKGKSVAGHCTAWSLRVHARERTRRDIGCPRACTPRHRAAGRASVVADDARSPHRANLASAPQSALHARALYCDSCEQQRAVSDAFRCGKPVRWIVFADPADYTETTRPTRARRHPPAALPQVHQPPPPARSGGSASRIAAILVIVTVLLVNATLQLG